VAANPLRGHLWGHPQNHREEISHEYKYLHRESGGQPSHHSPTSRHFRYHPTRRWIERQTPVTTAVLSSEDVLNCSSTATPKGGLIGPFENPKARPPKWSEYRNNSCRNDFAGAENRRWAESGSRHQLPSTHELAVMMLARWETAATVRLPPESQPHVERVQDLGRMLKRDADGGATLRVGRKRLRLGWTPRSRLLISTGFSCKSIFDSQILVVRDWRAGVGDGTGSCDGRLVQLDN
jgi:hypothetical protein